MPAFNGLQKCKLLTLISIQLRTKLRQIFFFQRTQQLHGCVVCVPVHFEYCGRFRKSAFNVHSSTQLFSFNSLFSLLFHLVVHCWSLALILGKVTYYSICFANSACSKGSVLAVVCNTQALSWLHSAHLDMALQLIPYLVEHTCSSPTEVDSSPTEADSSPTEADSSPTKVSSSPADRTTVDTDVSANDPQNETQQSKKRASPGSDTLPHLGYWKDLLAIVLLIKKAEGWDRQVRVVFSSKHSSHNTPGPLVATRIEYDAPEYVSWR